MRMSIAAKSGRKNEKCVNQNVKVITRQQSRKKGQKTSCKKLNKKNTNGKVKKEVRGEKKIERKMS